MFFGVLMLVAARVIDALIVFARLTISAAGGASGGDVAMRQATR